MVETGRDDDDLAACQVDLYRRDTDAVQEHGPLLAHELGGVGGERLQLVGEPRLRLDQRIGDRLDVLRDADFILQDEIRNAGLYRELWQSFCVLPDVRTVGVQGDERTYGYVVVIRAVTSDDAMTADWARLPYEVLERISSRVINEVPGVNRVAYDVTSKPPGTIEWE